MTMLLTAGSRDRYPSRRSTEAALLQREDPVVYGSPEDGPLDEKALDELDERGFLEVPDVFSATEVEGMLAEWRRLSVDTELVADGRAILEPDSDEVRSIFEVQSVSTLLDEVVRHPRIADVARQVLGSDVYLHQTRLNHRAGFDGTESWWHSDFETWHAEDGMPRPRALTASIALTDTLEQNGPLLILPGSHTTHVTCVDEPLAADYQDSPVKRGVGTPDATSLSLLADRCGIASCKGAAGSVVFFDANVLHGSNSNITPYPRASLVVVFNSVENALEEPFAGLPPRPSFMANRDPSPI